jgi:hypothetical protein
MGGVLAPSQSNAGDRCAFIVEEYSTRGKDSVLANLITAKLGYPISWLDIDTARTPAFYDTFKVVVSAGREVIAPAPSGNLDSVGKSITGWVTLNDANWDEINMGTGSSVLPDASGYHVNIGATRWPTKTNQSRIDFWTSTSLGSMFGFTFPDSFHDIRPVLIDKDNQADTAVVIGCIADSGAVIFNTGDGNYFAKGRRAFFGSFAEESTAPPNPIDSCLAYSLFLRFVAWAAKDTLNDGVMKYPCFSGVYEIDDCSPNENSSGTDSIETYGNWPDDYWGHDCDEKHTYIKIANSAIQKKIGNVYRSITVDSAYWRFRLKGIDNSSGSGTWATSVTLRQIKKYWVAGTCGGQLISPSCPFACWTYTRLDTAASPDVYYAWTSGGATGLGTDVYDDDVDSVTITDASAINSYYHVAVHEGDLQAVLLDTTQSHGWNNFVLYYSHNCGGVEWTSYAASVGTVASRPRINIRLSAFSTTVPAPTIVATPTSYSVSVTEGQNYPTQLLLITNSGAGAMDFAPTVVGGSWLSVNCIECSAPSYVSVIFTTSFQTIGSYADTINIAATGATNTPLKIIVNLTVTAVPPVTTSGQVSGVLRKR